MNGDDNDDLKSKSQLKREHLALQALGRQLVELPDSLLKRLPLSSALREEVVVGRKLQKGALQRQLRHLGGILEAEDYVAIQIAIKAALEPGVHEVRRMHELEALRAALLRDGDVVLERLAMRHPDLDRQHLRQLIRNARQEQEREQERPPRATRALYQFLKQLQSPLPPDH